MASVVVVGGGLAGLACAWRLQRAGHDVEVLEREPEAGGRVQSGVWDGCRADRGSPPAPGEADNLAALASALGIEERVRSHVRAPDAVLHEGRLHPVDFTSPLRFVASPLLPLGARARLGRLALRLLRHRRQLDPWRPELAAKLDRGDAAALLRPLVGEEAFEGLLAPLFASAFGSEPEDLSAAFALVLLRRVFASRRPASFSGGDGELARALARSLSVRAGREVVAVETETDGARIRYRQQGRENRVYADAAVVAVPGSQVVGLCPKLTPAERGFFEGVRYRRDIAVELRFENASLPLSHGRVAFSRREGLDLAALAVGSDERGAAPCAAGRIDATLTAAACDRLWPAGDDAVGRLVLENLARTPFGGLDPTATRVQRLPFTSPRFVPGHLSRLSAFFRRMERSPRMAFAGDYLVGLGAEFAATSGMRAANEIVRAL